MAELLLLCFATTAADESGDEPAQQQPLRRRRPAGRAALRLRLARRPRRLPRHPLAAGIQRRRCTPRGSSTCGGRRAASSAGCWEGAPGRVAGARKAVAGAEEPRQGSGGERR